MLSVKFRLVDLIPLGRFAGDEWAWIHEKNGIFLVNGPPNPRGKERIIMLVGKSYGDCQSHRKCDAFGGES